MRRFEFCQTGQVTVSPPNQQRWLQQVGAFIGLLVGPPPLLPHRVFDTVDRRGPLSAGSAVPQALVEAHSGPAGVFSHRLSGHGQSPTRPIPQRRPLRKIFTGRRQSPAGACGWRLSSGIVV
jgi:hypothetical protein